MVRRLGVIFSSRRRRRLGGGLALVAAVLVVGVVVLRASPPSKPSSGSQGDASGTATVQRRDLVETDTESGTIGYADPQTVYNRLSGTITWLADVGQVIKPGQTLFRIDGEPVTLMDGSAPAYRDLDASDTPGADIEQLNRNLVRLGFDPDGIVIDDQWQPATTAGVELLQESLGEDETGSLSLGQVVFLPGDQVISALDGTVGSTGGGGGGSATGSGPASAGASTSSGAGDPELVSLERTTSQHGTTPVVASKSSGASGPCQRAAGRSARARPTPTTATTTSASTTTSCTTSTTSTAAPKRRSPAAPRASNGSGELSKLTALLKAEASQLKAATAALKAAQRSSSSGSPSASRNSSSKSSDSGSGGAATAILQSSSTQLIVTVDLSASSQSEAKLGAPVMVELPSGKTADGTITAVSPVANTSNSSGSGPAAGGSPSSGTGASSTVPVTIRLKGHHRGAGLNQASVSVNFAQAEAKRVLSVPVTALIATAGGGYAVQEANAPYQRLPVTTGLFAAGDVQISGAGIHPGLRVTNSQG